MKKNVLLLLAAAAIPLLGASTLSMAAAPGESPLVTPSPASAPVAAPVQSAPQPNLQLELVNPASHQKESLSLNQVASADKMREFVAPVPNAAALYDTYLAQGYFPLHALILTSWDINEIMRSLSPALPDNPSLREKIASIHKLYQPAQ